MVGHPYFVTFWHGGLVQPGRDSVGGSPPIQAGRQAAASTQHLHEKETTPSEGEYQRGAERSQSLWTFARKFQFLVIKTLDPDSLEMLDPDPSSVNPDLQHYTKGPYLSRW